MSHDRFSKFVWVALVVVILAAVLLGMVIESNLRPATIVSGTPKYDSVAMVVQGGWKLGSTGIFHDAFVPCNFTVYSGQIVNLTVLSFDTGNHSFTSPTLGVNFQIPGGNVTGVPTVSNFQFTVSTPGVYRWYCAIPCDTGAGGWAMSTGTDGQPGQIGYMGGVVTVLQGQRSYENCGIGQKTGGIGYEAVSLLSV